MSPKPRAPAPGRRLEPDARREEILAAAIRAFGEQPYASLSTAALAEAAGVTRSLIHHYFGSKRGLYLEVVRRMVQLPPIEHAVPAAGSIDARIARSVAWYLDVVGTHGKTYVAVSGASGMGDDPEVQRIIRRADAVAANKLLALVGLDATAEAAERAAVLAFGGLLRATMRAWVLERTLTRAQAEHVLSRMLVCLVSDVLPTLTSAPRPRR
jgi:AcrR family transcriptional regulator